MYQLKQANGDLNKLRDIIDSNNLEQNELLFGFICAKGMVEVARWMLYNTKVNLSANDDLAFRNACEYNQLPVAQMLDGHSKRRGIEIKIHIYNEYPFRKACRHGNLEFIEWLWIISGYTIDLTCKNGYTFRHACKNGHLDLVKWLLIKRNIDIGVKDNYALTRACKNGHLHILKFFIENYNVNYHYDDDLLFRTACEYGHLEIAQYLYKLDDKINIYYNFSEVFRNACSNNKISVAQWLQTLETKFKLTVENNKIIGFNFLSLINDDF